MRGRRYKPIGQHAHDIELDLAPLLAVMVKLVPVLLLSSSFVPISVVESELPQVVKEAIERNISNENDKVAIQLEISNKTGFRILVDKKGDQQVFNIPLKENKLDLAALHEALVKVKKQYPTIFKLELTPDADVPYKEVVRAMDQARKSHDKSVRFPVLDKKTNKEIMTEFMFPDVVFTNVMEG